MDLPDLRMTSHGGQDTMTTKSGRVVYDVHASPSNNSDSSDAMTQPSVGFGTSVAAVDADADVETDADPNKDVNMTMDAVSKPSYLSQNNSDSGKDKMAETEKEESSDFVSAEKETSVNEKLEKPESADDQPSDDDNDDDKSDMTESNTNSSSSDVDPSSNDDSSNSNTSSSTSDTSSNSNTSDSSSDTSTGNPES